MLRNRDAHVKEYLGILLQRCYLQVRLLRGKDAWGVRMLSVSGYREDT